MTRRRRWARRGGLALLAALVAIQLVPYGRDHAAPPVTDEVAWPDAGARELAVAACYDCHSDETVWPVYSFVAPMSWLVQRDVDGGREALNFSAWARSEEDGEEAAEAVEEGSMPPRQYQLLHPDARLSDEERRRLVTALEALPEPGSDGPEGDGGDSSGPGGGGDGDGDRSGRGDGEDNSG